VLARTSGNLTDQPTDWQLPNTEKQRKLKDFITILLFIRYLATLSFRTEISISFYRYPSKEHCHTLKQCGK
jgi:hypothetical protein